LLRQHSETVRFPTKEFEEDGDDDRACKRGGNDDAGVEPALVKVIYSDRFPYNNNCLVSAIHRLFVRLDILSAEEKMTGGSAREMDDLARTFAARAERNEKHRSHKTTVQ
jgi:hypothetical protein